MMRKSAIAFMAMLLLAGCYYDKAEVLYPGSFCDTANVTYSGTAKSILETNCAISGCHVSGGTGPGNFTSYADVKQRVDNGTFRILVLENRTMPPSFSLSSCELEQLSIWLDAGAPEN
ncbi:MAG: hypothetical protein IPG74_03685 [Flavobacteriales bacterium]|nr:hypothetical protein [Flavobacteriales bacterium]MBK7553894.1 hypothetical protein [Flavobacteriales bacterium]MBK9194366.1 hypothetical protein [Flavobacteriales bacterium]